MARARGDGRVRGRDLRGRRRRLTGRGRRGSKGAVLSRDLAKARTPSAALLHTGDDPKCRVSWVEASVPGAVGGLREVAFRDFLLTVPLRSRRAAACPAPALLAAPSGLASTSVSLASGCSARAYLGGPRCRRRPESVFVTLHRDCRARAALTVRSHPVQPGANEHDGAGRATPVDDRSPPRSSTRR